jgi:hypothetical protein
MAVDPRLVTVAPDESDRVIPDRLDVTQLEVAALHELNRTFMTLAVRARTEAAQELVRVDTPVPVCPVDFHDSSATGRTQLDGLQCVAHEKRPSQLLEAAAVRSRTETVAWLASSSASASRISWRSRSGQGCSANSEVA